MSLPKGTKVSFNQACILFDFMYPKPVAIPAGAAGFVIGYDEEFGTYDILLEQPINITIAGVPLLSRIVIASTGRVTEVQLFAV